MRTLWFWVVQAAPLISHPNYYQNFFTNFYFNHLLSSFYKPTVDGYSCVIKNRFEGEEVYVLEKEAERLYHSGHDI